LRFVVQQFDAKEHLRHGFAELLPLGLSYFPDLIIGLMQRKTRQRVPSKALGTFHMERRGVFMTVSTQKRNRSGLKHTLQPGIILAIVAMAIAGCGSNTPVRQAATIITTPASAYQRDLARSPKVVFIGDDTTLNWFPQTALWINKGVAGDTSGKMLARFQTDVIDLHPDIVHILLGTYDVSSETPWQVACGPATGATATCANLDAMVTMAQAAKIKVIIGTPTPWGSGSLATQLQNQAATVAKGNEEFLCQSLRYRVQYDPLYAGIPLVDYNQVLSGGGPGDSPFLPNLTDNGIDPNAAGYALMTPLAETAIAALKVGGGPK
jgi:lysophospholipase L1-like esterase